MDAKEVWNMEEIQDLRRKVNHLEYEEIKQIKEDVSNIKKDLALNSLLTQQSIDTQKELKETFSVFQGTMKDISFSIKNIYSSFDGLHTDVKELKTQFKDMDEKVDIKFKENDDRLQELDDKGKIDYLQCFKEGGWKTTVGWIVLFGVVVYEVLGKIGIF